ncbi:hypothetical protein EVAR_52271_1 [Eumeta japonica]|uniref:Sodium/potassium-transporting ATPase subunit beta-2 n=1 Tax=Eumeta variegata TaxID=151549 RepID=A0A4C1YVU9_EUMVA|nr:hypothetical protein EVAR_52271_1 [Eumeta japonica]
MGHRPILYEEGALIWFDGDNATQVQRYTENIDDFLAPYMNKSLLINKGVNQVECGLQKPPRNEVCAFDVRQLGPCSPQNGYGYSARKPCVIIKLNKAIRR